MHILAQWVQHGVAVKTLSRLIQSSKEDFRVVQLPPSILKNAIIGPWSSNNRWFDSGC